jgi:hypothetical protein
MGDRYLLRGQPVTVLARGGGRSRGGLPGGAPARRSPASVLVQYADGSRAVRPARGLRRMEPDRG